MASEKKRNSNCKKNNAPVTPHDLPDRINDYLTKTGIQADRLKYEWDGDDEASVNERFDNYNKRMRAYLNKQNIKCLKCLLKEIISEWGGINGLTKETYSRYSDILQGLWTHRKSKTTFQTSESNLSIDPACPICASNITHPSSWTKVLAAYDPDQFLIYDSRVAIALCVLYEDEKWFIPAPKGNNNNPSQLQILRQKLMENRKGKKSLNAHESYKLYLQYLGTVSKPRHYEKQLFMLGGLLQYDPVKKKIVAKSSLLNSKCKICSYPQTNCSGKKSKKNK